jgi:hypothetical protein
MVLVFGVSFALSGGVIAVLVLNLTLKQHWLKKILGSDLAGMLLIF